MIVVGTIVALLLIGGFGSVLGNGRGGSESPSLTMPSARGGQSEQAAGSAGNRTSSGPSPIPLAFPPIAGIPCDSVAHEDDYHVHAHLNVRVDGALTLPPAAIGIRAGCLYWIHTHNAHGVIHVEAPSDQGFTLGQFFAIWGEPLSASRVGDASVGPGRSLFVFINRAAVQVADPATIPLNDLSAIELQIGAAPLTPLPYTFPSDLGGG